jgi:hypothetical protein
VQSDQRQWWSSGLSITKLCRKCSQRKTLPQFPRDRSEPDGRWHTCKECHVPRQRLKRAEARERRKQELVYSLPPPPAPRWRLDTLTKAYRHKTSGADHLPFGYLEPRRRFIARQLDNKYVAKHGPRISQPKAAVLTACAASNSARVGDKFWAHSMRMRKGWRRRREREFAELLRQAQMRALSGQRHQADYETGAGWTSASRLAGI